MRDSCKTCLKENLLLLATICGVVIGIVFGVGMRSLDPPLDNLDIEYLKFPGSMLLQGLKMVVLPLIIFSIISGVASLDSKTTGKIGGYAVAYYAVTTVLGKLLKPYSAKYVLIYSILNTTLSIGAPTSD